MRKIYLATRYSSNPEMRVVRDMLHSLGFYVTSRWIDLHLDATGDPQLNASFTPEFLTTSPELAEPFAQIDLEDIDAADTVISFTYHNGGGKGGRHVEFGYALKACKRMIVIGPRENVFHTHERVTQFDNMYLFADDLAYHGDCGTQRVTELLNATRRRFDDVPPWYG